MVFFDSSGGIADLVKQGTPRQSVNCGGVALNVSYGSNSAGKKTILISLAKTSAFPGEFVLSDMNISIPPGSSLRITLDSSNRPEKMEGTPPHTTTIMKRADPPSNFTPPAITNTEKTASTTTSTTPPETPLPTPSTQTPAPPVAPTDSPSVKVPPLAPPSPSLASASSASFTPYTASPNSPPPPPQTMAEEGPLAWPGKFLSPPIPTGQLEEDRFYIRTEGGARFVSSMNIVNVVGPQGPSNPIIEKEIAFSTGYRQDIDAGVWLTDWFGLAIETGFALNAIRGNTEGMTVSSSTYWSVPIMAQLCFQYPNESGFLPYINLGFGGGWNYFKIGNISYPATSLGYSLSGSGNDMDTAYQIAAGIRYRLYDQLSLTLSYKFYGTSQPTVDMGDNQQVTFGSPVTNSIEIGGNFAF